jgi:hypothetical protein
VATGEVATASFGLPVDRVAVTRAADGAWWGVALLKRANADTNCMTSSLAAFPLDAPATGTMMDSGLGLADVSGDLRTGMVLVADRCGDRVLRFDPVAGSLDIASPVMSLAAPTVVAASDRRVWAIGHDLVRNSDPDMVPDGIVDAWLILGSADLDTGDASVDALPSVIERVLADDADFPDQDVLQDLHANSAIASDLVVMPGGEQIAFTMSAVLHGDDLYDNFGTLIIPHIDITTQEYWLIDASTRSMSQRVRASCGISIGSCDPFYCYDQWTCLSDIDDARVGNFTPTGLAALFGDR